MSQYNKIPSRLVMKKGVDYCEICDNGKGRSIDVYISYDDKFGFISCMQCKDIAKRYAQDWKDNGYGDANILQGKQLKVKRSCGTIETNWKLDNEKQFIYIDSFGSQLVSCTNADYYKWVNIEELLELNM
jgi:hypothetical protein